jgi:hypothetical protein
MRIYNILKKLLIPIIFLQQVYAGIIFALKYLPKFKSPSSLNLLLGGGQKRRAFREDPIAAERG